MPGNWVTFSDWRRLLEKIRRHTMGSAMRKVRRRRRQRISQTWEENRFDPLVHFWNIPEVKVYWNRCVSGDPGVGHREYIAAKYFKNKSGLLALSIGCGVGGNERSWASLGCFSRIDAFDLSPALIQNAKETAAHDGWAAVLNFFCADLREFKAPENHYDVIFAEGSLHHLAPMEIVMQRIRGWLKPAGLFLVNDFTGPSHFAWTRRQLQAAEALLALLPERLRHTWSGGIKKRVDRPGRLRMWLADPSEAAESSLILPLLGRYFEVLEKRDKGGTIINLVFEGIAHHFCGEDSEAAGFLRLFLESEQLLLQSGEISSDFILVLCRKPEDAAEKAP